MNLKENNIFFPEYWFMMIRVETDATYYYYHYYIINITH